MAITVYPPSNLEAVVTEGEVALSWDEDDSVDGYKVYQNGVLIGTTPCIQSSFQFPFSNESVSTNLLEMSTFRYNDFIQPISPNTQYTFSITAYSGSVESEPTTITVYYERYIKINSISLVPNPVTVNGLLSIAANVETGITTNIT